MLTKSKPDDAPRAVRAGAGGCRRALALYQHLAARDPSPAVPSQAGCADPSVDIKKLTETEPHEPDAPTTSDLNCARRSCRRPRRFPRTSTTSSAWRTRARRRSCSTRCSRSSFGWSATSSHHSLHQGTESFAEALTYFPEPSEFTSARRVILRHIAQGEGRRSTSRSSRSLNGSTLGGWTSYRQADRASGRRRDRAEHLLHPHRPRADRGRRHRETLPRHPRGGEGAR